MLWKPTTPAEPETAEQELDEYEGEFEGENKGEYVVEYDGINPLMFSLDFSDSSSSSENQVQSPFW